MPAPKTPKTAKAQVAQVIETIENNVTELFPMSTAEVPEAFREMAEKSVAQAREGYAKMKGAAEEATDLLEESLETARANTMDLSHVALDAAKANFDAGFAFLKDFMAVKTVSEAVELQTAFARERFEASTASAKDMQAKVTKMSEEAAKPVKAALTKSMEAFKAA
jgi:phasin